MVTNRDQDFVLSVEVVQIEGWVGRLVQICILCKCKNGPALTEYQSPDYKIVSRPMV